MNIIKVYITAMYNLYSCMFRHFRVIVGEFTSDPRNLENLCNLARRRCKFPHDDMKMSKHVGVKIIRCCDIYFYDIHCACVGYNKQVNKHE
jgi:hypothetical protein